MATVPKEGMASPSLTVVSLPCIGLSTSLSEPQFLHHKMERFHRMREDIHNTEIHNSQFNRKDRRSHRTNGKKPEYIMYKKAIHK